MPGPIDIDIGVATPRSRHLLCAVPQLVDPNFVRSVVLMVDHNDEGAFGLVLNHPLPTRVAEVTQALGLPWRGSPEVLVRLGGPVEPVRGFILHDRIDWDPLADPLADDLFLTATLDGIRSEEGIGAAGHFLFTLGYAGWGEGQLEEEMTSGSWIAVPIGEPGIGVSGRWIFETPPETMWEGALASIGVDPARLVGHRGIGEPTAKA